MGAGQALVALVCCATAILMLPVSVLAVRAGTLHSEVVAVLVLLPLALLEPLLAVVSAIQTWPTLAAALALANDMTARALPEDNAANTPLALLPIVDRLELDRVAARGPGSSEPVFEDVTASVARGEWLVVEGPSGSGKSMLLTLLMGYLRADAGSYTLAGHDTAALSAPNLRKHIAWAPQEGHLFDSTIRANLLVARPRGDELSDAELTEVIHRVGLGGLLKSLPQGLETRIGSQGSHLSGGQRQRLAVARTLLTRADVLLLDEPSAHLDEESASRLMADLHNATEDKLTVLVTHRATDIRPDDLVVDITKGHKVVQPWQTAGVVTRSSATSRVRH